jgi:hypothetical protein
MTTSIHHETVLDLIRERPGFVPDLLAKLDVSLPLFTTAHLSDSALHEPAPVEHFADAVVVLSREERPVLGVIVEAQLRRDDQKLYTWPQYAMNARARHKCPFLVMVATPSPSVARWAGQPIDVGNGTVFRQHIIGPETIPKVTDAAQAAREPELAVLSALIHARDNTPAARLIASAAIRGVSELPDERLLLLYSGMVWNALSAALRKELEQMVDIRKYMNATERRNYDKAEAKGEARGEARGEAKAVLKILVKRGLPITPHQQRQISECTDLATLDRWLDHALTAGSVDELLGKALDLESP